MQRCYSFSPGGQALASTLAPKGLCQTSSDCSFLCRLLTLSGVVSRVVLFPKAGKNINENRNRRMRERKTEREIRSWLSFENLKNVSLRVSKCQILFSGLSFIRIFSIARISHSIKADVRRSKCPQQHTPIIFAVLWCLVFWSDHAVTSRLQFRKAHSHIKSFKYRRSIRSSLKSPSSTPGPGQYHHTSSNNSGAVHAFQTSSRLGMFTQCPVCRVCLEIFSGKIDIREHSYVGLEREFAKANRESIFHRFRIWCGVYALLC